ncbi:MAG: U32 family peptidase [Lachnospiraceae bacterium]|nr:U32 family peptidase [Lachnospiraceae bacterium]MDD3614966.1 U32 family peptidase [Lachnospiraceae bacterium]
MKTELLAPAGSIESLKAAIEAGADAVYIGGSRFGARAYADNPEEDVLLEGISYAHLRGRKIYMTVNTLLKNQELGQDFYDYLLPYYKAGLDAVIVQDMGVFRFIHQAFPDLDIHASTQMAITGVGSAKLLESMGATRVVTARELTLEEIAAIHKASSVEIESFVHGALCYCYSGECLFSSMLGGRSGNRGRCAQPCRLSYEVYEHNDRISSQQEGYPLSTKDMCTIEILPEIIQSGVYSLKIEGRMKKPEYTAGVVSIYRKYLDLYEKDPRNYCVAKSDLQTLYDIYNRDGFHTGYYKDYNGPAMIARWNKKQEKTKRNEDVFQKIQNKYIQAESKLPVQLKLQLKKNEPAVLTATSKDVSYRAEGETVLLAQNRPLSKEQVEKKISQLGNTDFTAEKLDIQMDLDAFLPIGKINELRRDAICGLKEKLLSSTMRETKEHTYTNMQNSNALETEERIYVETATDAQFTEALKFSWVDGIYLDLGMCTSSQGEVNTDAVSRYIRLCKDNGKICCLSYPYMTRGNKADYSQYVNSWIQEGIQGILVRNLDNYENLKNMGLEKQIILDYNLYTMNNLALDQYKALGYLRNTIPYELNEKELYHRRNANSEMIVYGYIPLMISAQCVKKNYDRCTKKQDVLYLKDRYQKKFPVKCNCHSCYNTIYNSVPLMLWTEKKAFRRMGISNYRLSFTLENQTQTNQILRDFEQGFIKEEKTSIKWDYTKGHFKRGVE